MSSDPPKSEPTIRDLDEATVIGQIEVVTAAGEYRKPFALQQIKGPGAPRVHELDLDEVVIGRSNQAHISIDSGLLSRRHIALHKNGPEYTCSDLDSSNGMYLNGVKTHSVVLREGDTIQIGDVVFVYHEGA